MKKTAAFILTLSFIFLLTACGNTQGSAPGVTAGEPAETEKSNQTTEVTTMPNETQPKAKLLYMGHASIRITTPEGKVIYIDPYAGEGYEPAADLILVTHSHFDHKDMDKIKNRAPDCRVITWEEALEGGEHQTFELGYVTVEATEAGYNRNHDVKSCVGYILTLSDGVSVYLSGDTSKTEQMPKLAEKQLDYAFFCCDGVYNMNIDEAVECARLVGAKHNIPYHVIAAQNSKYYDRARAEQFDAPGRLIINENEEIKLTKQGV